MSSPLSLPVSRPSQKSGKAGPNKSRKILIVKTGFSEVLDMGISTTVSLGDVLACTSLLHLFKDDEVTWVTSWAARQLLLDNPWIAKLLIFGTDALREISGQSFDILVNLEKDNGLCTFLNHVQAKERFGFYFSDEIHDIVTFKRSTRYLLVGQENQKGLNKNSYEVLYETVGQQWQGQAAILPRRMRRPEKFDIGFNHAVGTKWPTKAWPMERWKQLEKLLKKDFSVSWQQGFQDLSLYMDWIDSCRLIVTSDSLGQVVAHAFGKKVITLYGSTNYKRMERVPHIRVIPSGSKCAFMPCYLPVCKNDKFCMDEISAQRVADECREFLSP